MIANKEMPSDVFRFYKSPMYVNLLPGRAAKFEPITQHSQSIYRTYTNATLKPIAISQVKNGRNINSSKTTS